MARHLPSSGALQASTATTNVVGDSLLAALALVLVVEGALPLLAPRIWREAFQRLVSLTDGQLRFVGLVSIVLCWGFVKACDRL